MLQKVKKLPKIAKGAQNLKSCGKVAEQLVAKPIAWTLLSPTTPFKRYPLLDFSALKRMCKCKCNRFSVKNTNPSQR